MNNKNYHIVSGDALAEGLKKCGIGGELIICSECLINGPLNGDNLAEFWKTRAAFISEEYGAADYFEKVVAEFEKTANIPAGSEVNLWFGNDLFCQVNMWFVTDLLAAGLKVFRVFPFEKGSPSMDFSSGECDDLKKSLEMRVEFFDSDLGLAQNLWEAYKVGDFESLAELSKSESACFQRLDDACHAHIDRFGDDPRPQRVLQKIMSEGKKDFGEIFQEFGKREPIYGFGDSQVKRLLED